MAENESGQDKTEEPTGKRLQDARSEGQVARSKELQTFVLLTVGAIGLMIFGPAIGKGVLNLAAFNFSLDRQHLFDERFMIMHLVASLKEIMLATAPFFALLVVAAVAGSVSVGGWLFSGKALAPKLSKMDPVQGLKRMVSVNGLVELGKGLGKFLLIGGVALTILWARFDDLMSLGQQDVGPAITFALWILAWVVLMVSASTILIALIDVPFQIWSHNKKLKMTKQEVKDEVKDTEGKPEVKSRIRQLQYDMTQQRMMSEVPKADVVITNPEHYAVALKYDPDNAGAPVLLAKGEDLIALKIREVAEFNGVTILQEPPLARAIWYSTEIGHEIPAGLYVAVAQILAYVFQLQRFDRSGGRKPKRPDIDVPEDLRYEPKA